METEIAPNLHQMLGVLRRRAPWIALCVILATAAAYGLSERQAKRYTAMASLVFNNAQLAQEVAGLPIASTNSEQAQQNTNLKLVELGNMGEKTASLVGHGFTKDTIQSAISVSSQGESNIVEVSATARSPQLAAEIANTYSEQFVDEQQSSNHAYYASALKLVNKQISGLSANARAGTVGLALQDRAQSLGVLAELRNGNVQVAQAAQVPTSPSAPRVVRNTVLGVALGLLLGLGVAFLFERFDQRIREPKDLERIYGLPLLGVVPESSALSRSTRSRRHTNGVLPAGESEAFHLIRAHLRYFNVDREMQVLLVASAAPGDGKTTIARHLAAAAARMGSRVLLLEADLRRPTVAQQLDIASGPGLSDVLIGAATLSSATQQIDLGSGSGLPSRTLDALVAGAALPPNPGELIESQAMMALLARVRNAYDLVVIDTPPLTVVSDAFPLLGKADGVLIVGRVGRNRRDVAERLRETLNGAGAPLLGVVANGLRTGRLGPYGYSYKYTTAGSTHGGTDRAPALDGGDTANGARGSHGVVTVAESIAAGKG